MGCWMEARRADKVAGHLSRLRDALALDFYDHISAVLRGVEFSIRLLRDLYDLFPIYRVRVPTIVYHLNVILPTLCKSLEEMLKFIDNPGLPDRAQWTLMHEMMGDQAGMTLSARFVLYNDFFVQLIRLLSRRVFLGLLHCDWMVLTECQQISLLRSHCIGTVAYKTATLKKSATHQR